MLRKPQCFFLHSNTYYCCKEKLKINCCAVEMEEVYYTRLLHMLHLQWSHI